MFPKQFVILSRSGAQAKNLVFLLGNLSISENEILRSLWLPQDDIQEKHSGYAEHGTGMDVKNSL
jgi:hypothetical protein